MGTLAGSTNASWSEFPRAYIQARPNGPLAWAAHGTVLTPVPRLRSSEIVFPLNVSPSPPYPPYLSLTCFHSAPVRLIRSSFTPRSAMPRLSPQMFTSKQHRGIRKLGSMPSDLLLSPDAPSGCKCDIGAAPSSGRHQGASLLPPCHSDMLEEMSGIHKDPKASLCSTALALIHWMREALHFLLNRKHRPPEARLLGCKNDELWLDPEPSFSALLRSSSVPTVRTALLGSSCAQALAPAGLCCCRRPSFQQPRAYRSGASARHGSFLDIRWEPTGGHGRGCGRSGSQAPAAAEARRSEALS